MILHLTLKKQWFDLMVTGQKTVEYRRPSKWIKDRLVDKEYEVVKFVNGYGDDKPYFLCEYKGYEISKSSKQHDYNGFKVKYEKGDYLIHLGKIIETGNLID